MSKNLLIIERSASDLKTDVSEDGSVYLEGIFTEFGVKNKNNRIYEESEVLPHINELQQKIKKQKLLGELDHPKDFDISLSNVSHVIEEINYDPSTKQVRGKIRLLNTTKGKEAQALVNDGIPLHISSRAAGTVDENNKVKIKKFFTYDLVADPGFENAELSRVNESFGFENDSSLYIYEMEETKTKDKKSLEMTNENQYVSVEDFNKYTEYLKNEINNLKESTSSNDNEMVEKLIKYSEHIAEQVNNLTEYAGYLAENLDKSISHSDYIVNNVNQIKEYSSYLAEQLDNSIKYSEHIAEKTDQSIEYAQYVAEKADQNIRFSNYLAEKLDGSIQYTEHVAEGADKGIQFANYLAEKLDQSIAYAEYLKEGLERGISYSEYIAEQINTEYETALNESRNAKSVTKSKETYDSYTSSLNEKLDSLIKKAEEKSSSNMFFMNFLTESKKQQFQSLTDDKKGLIVEKMNSDRCMSTVDADRIWESCFTPEKKPLNFIDDIPEKFQTKWESLSEARKFQIIAESKMYTLDTPYKINNFWSTRDLRDTVVGLEKLNESKTAAEQAMIQNNGYAVNEEYRQALVNKVRFNLGK